MAHPLRAITETPLRIAVSYAAFGVSWIVVTDQLALVLAETPAQLTQLQTAKGWLFVALSTLLVYGLVATGQRRLQRTNARLDDALWQASVLHRILRHNLRNSCAIIDGYTTMLEGHVSGDGREHLETVARENRELMQLSAKSKRLRDAVYGTDFTPATVDVVETVSFLADTVTEEYPETRVEIDLPESLSIETHPRIGNAIHELLENAIEHDDTGEPAIHITGRSRDGGGVTIEIADEGPGLPDVEREVLERGLEAPMFHSEGVGLWIVHCLVRRSGGSLEILDNEPRGTVVRISLPPSPPDLPETGPTVEERPIGGSPIAG